MYVSYQGSEKVSTKFVNHGILEDFLTHLFMVIA
jgi:hypothetical protein